MSLNSRALEPCSAAPASRRAAQQGGSARAPSARHRTTRARRVLQKGLSGQRAAPGAHLGRGAQADAGRVGGGRAAVAAEQVAAVAAGAAVDLVPVDARRLRARHLAEVLRRARRPRIMRCAMRNRRWRRGAAACAPTRMSGKRRPPPGQPAALPLAYQRGAGDCAPCRAIAAAHCLAAGQAATGRAAQALLRLPDNTAGARGRTRSDRPSAARKVDSAGRRSRLPACSSKSLQLTRAPAAPAGPAQHALHWQAMRPSAPSTPARGRGFSVSVPSSSVTPTSERLQPARGARG